MSSAFHSALVVDRRKRYLTTKSYEGNCVEKQIESNRNKYIEED